MIQLNLLPDVKQQFIKTRRTKRLITLISVLSAGSAFGVMAILFFASNVWQTRTIDSLTKDIQSNLSELQSVPDLDKILTVQEQLNSLDMLHSQKTAATRLYTYLPQILPQGVYVSELIINYEESTLEISGNTDSLESVNKFVDTIKFTDYIVFEVVNTETGEILDSEAVRAFNEVVLGSSEIDPQADDINRDTSFSVTATFDPVIFDTATENVRLVVPQTVTSRSQTEQPGVIFDSQTDGGINE